MARILLIEDDDALRTVLCKIMVHFGHTVIEARDGAEGLALFKQAHADILITDILMPKKEGFEVLMELRKIHPPVKIIAMSGGGRLGAVEYLHIAKLMGATRALEKPFTQEVLMAVIDELLADGGASAKPPLAP